ncbi:TonB-dependent receptor [Ideonella sp. 4Y16]|uniref:TonB-dependent receptor n=1 Tax=Ideonella alba TaxID=2824118 RepID=A0A940YIQ8_9BURK|nr:TonB-dependent receptor [Ideonella alba]MBQ0930629.1 TonB-dependent receptor [Ideonella alba]MBQ0944749.1 TonB-dependent receptor [Ideonella alba]
MPPPNRLLPLLQRLPRSQGRRRARHALLALGATLATVPSVAVELGPFSLTGFAKAEATSTTNVCEDCQRELGENRQRVWADDLAFGKPFGTRADHVTLFQPYLGYKQRVGGGFEVFGLLSQRWRDGKVDLDGWLYERNLGVAHEDWGRLTIGAMTTRGWSVPDYPYAFKAIGSDFWGGGVGSSTAWSDSGAAYGLLSRAVRYMSRPVEMFGGDVLLEATYDFGKSGWTRNRPSFLELYAKYIGRDLLVDVIVQSAKNGEPVAWGKAPFGGLTPFPADDPLLGGSSQGMAMLMVRHLLNPQLELSGGVRFNRWSGAYAVQTTPGALGRWNNMFNVDWGGVDANGVPNPGYAARSTDGMLGVRYRWDDQLTLGAGLVYLGRASTKNPSERGQSNTLSVASASVGYTVNEHINLYASASAYQYGRKGLAPLSMPANDAFTRIDSRVATRGNSVAVGVNFTF